MKMIPYQKALSILLKAAQSIPAEQVPVIKAYKRVLREDVRSPYPIPPFPKATMDGYAVKAADTLKATTKKPARLAVLEDVPAGKVPVKSIKPGYAIRIMTGAPLPRGAEAVVMVEDTQRDGRFVKIYKRVKKDDNTGRAGEDVKKGEIIIHKGARIEPADMGMMAACGKVKVRVSKKPRVAIISTGDELIEPGKPLKPGKIRDANSYSLFGLCRDAGAEPELLGIARDRKGGLERKLQKTAAYDLLILSGGVSTGDYDIVQDILKQQGVKPLFWKVAIKPGKPIFAGKRNKQIVLGLPGNPVSVIVTFLLFIGPLIDKMTSRVPAGLKRGTAILDEDIKIKPGRRKFQRAYLEIKNQAFHVKPFPNQKSGVLRSMIETDVLIDVPGDVASIKKGQSVDIIFME